MDPVTLALGYGALKGIGGFFGGKRKEKEFERQQELNAVKAATMPWLGLKPVDIEKPGSKWGAALGGALTGAGTGLVAGALAPAGVMNTLGKNVGEVGSRVWD